MTYMQINLHHNYLNMRSGAASARVHRSALTGVGPSMGMLTPQQHVVGIPARVCCAVRNYALPCVPARTPNTADSTTGQSRCAGGRRVDKSTIREVSIGVLIRRPIHPASLCGSPALEGCRPPRPISHGRIVEASGGRLVAVGVARKRVKPGYVA